MSLVNYSDSSSSDEDTVKNVVPENDALLFGPDTPSQTKSFLPKAEQKLGVKLAQLNDEQLDDYRLHEGRIRSFKHERGNWATHVYIPVDLAAIEDVQDMCQNIFPQAVRLHRLPDLHISLSKTIVLPYHLIESFNLSLKRSLDGFVRFAACFRNLKIYTNEEKTRTFIGLEVGALYFDKFYNLMSAVDSVMQEYKLAQFFKDASYHASFLWCIGDQEQRLKMRLAGIQANSINLMEQLNENFCVDIRDIHCKTGNKQFVYQLK